MRQAAYQWGSGFVVFGRAPFWPWSCHAKSFHAQAGAERGAVFGIGVRFTGTDPLAPLAFPAASNARTVYTLVPFGSIARVVACVVVIAAAAASAYVVRRHIDRLDLVAVLKTRD